MYLLNSFWEIESYNALEQVDKISGALRSKTSVNAESEYGPVKLFFESGSTL